MDEVKEDKPVTKSEFKNELKSIRTDFKEAIFELNKGIQDQIKTLQEQMKPLENLDGVIFRNMLKVLIPIGLAFVWWIDRDFEKIQLSISQYNEQNQARLAALESVSFTPTNAVILTKMSEVLDAYNESKRASKDKKKVKKKINTGIKK